jgi:3'(2'), 5'-bisphosphate nucleotidase
MSIDIQIALQAVEKASRLCELVQSQLITEDTLTKKDKSPVTVADFGAQAIVLQYLGKHYPEIPVTAEESAAELLKEENQALCDQVVHYVQQIDSSLTKDDIIQAISRGSHPGGANGAFWTLDPIDGTKGFIRKEQYAIALALIENGIVTKGVVGCPNLPNKQGEIGSIFYAEKDKGAWELPKSLSGSAQKIQTSGISEASDGCFCESVESGHSSHDQSAEISRLLNISKEPVRMDSQCKYAAVARGDADIYLRLPTRAGYEEKIWDHAAGAILLEEAGGSISDIQGNSLDFSQGKTLKNNSGVVASTSGIFNTVIDAVKESFACSK